jgi:hypothetical protein
MTGVEILTTTEVATAYNFCWTAFWVIEIIAFLAGVGLTIYLWYENGYFEPLLLVLIPIFICMGGLLGCLIGVTFETPKEYETQYKVTISDEVNFNEFNEKYEVIEQDGKLYTIRERE